MNSVPVLADGTRVWWCKDHMTMQPVGESCALCVVERDAVRGDAAVVEAEPSEAGCRLHGHPVDGAALKSFAVDDLVRALSGPFDQRTAVRAMRLALFYLAPERLEAIDSQETPWSP